MVSTGEDVAAVAGACSATGSVTVMVLPGTGLPELSSSLTMSTVAPETPSGTVPATDTSRETSLFVGKERTYPLRNMTLPFPFSRSAGIPSVKTTVFHRAPARSVSSCRVWPEANVHAPEGMMERRASAARP